jgi:thiol-disulfide isomerase/thioredoxin
MRTALLAAALLLTLAAAPLPRLGDTASPPVATPYDTNADAHAAVDTAFARARANGHKVMLDFGGNWCPDCRALAGVLANPAVQGWTAENYETVLIDVGRFKKNLDIAQRYGVKITAAPTVLVLTPGGKLLNGDRVFALADARSMSGQAVVDLLADWRKLD